MKPWLGWLWRHKKKKNLDLVDQFNAADKSREGRYTFKGSPNAHNVPDPESVPDNPFELNDDESSQAFTLLVVIAIISFFVFSFLDTPLRRWVLGFFQTADRTTSRGRLDPVPRDTLGIE